MGKNTVANGGEKCGVEMCYYETLPWCLKKNKEQQRKHNLVAGY